MPRDAAARKFKVRKSYQLANRWRVLSLLVTQPSAKFKQLALILGYNSATPASVLAVSLGVVNHNCLGRLRALELE